jgi:acyl-CoA thioester hydrolase
MSDTGGRRPMRSRGEYRHVLTLPTRWQDNDAYGHINNAAYYGFIDTAVNRYLIDGGFLDWEKGEVIGLVAENGCRYAKPIAFPDPVTVGLCVTRIGNSSVRYEAGLFSGDEEDASAEGYYVHVYVDRATMRPAPLPDALRSLLEPLLLPGQV